MTVRPPASLAESTATISPIAARCLASPCICIVRALSGMCNGSTGESSGARLATPGADSRVSSLPGRML